MAKDKFSNGLDDAQTERIDILQEEAAEVVQAGAKVKRHGFESFSPFDQLQKTNRLHLEEEIGHFLAAVDLLVLRGDLDVMRIGEAKARKMTSYNHRRWTHHQ